MPKPCAGPGLVRLLIHFLAIMPGQSDPQEMGSLAEGLKRG